MAQIKTQRILQGEEANEKLKKKILLVEDATMTIAVMKKEIEFLGYECTVALNGKEALWHLRPADPPDCHAGLSRPIS